MLLRHWPILVFGSFLGLQAQATLSPRHACDQINLIYTMCGHDLAYDGVTFHFNSSKEKTSMVCTDARQLSFYDRVLEMDVASILMIPYEPGSTALPETRQNWDPGRLRAEPLLKDVYGENETVVRANLVPVDFLGQKVMFQKRLGAASALKKVGQELENLIVTDREAKDFLAMFISKKKNLTEMTFDWRFIRGTTRLSTHSFGTAIDLLADTGHQYWLWDELAKNKEKADKGEDAYRDTHFIPEGAPYMPAGIVETFERNGFIWGGKWNHFDTMHFEYRPEFFPSHPVDCAK